MVPAAAPPQPGMGPGGLPPVGVVTPQQQQPNPPQPPILPGQPPQQAMMVPGMPVGSSATLHPGGAPTGPPVGIPGAGAIPMPNGQRLAELFDAIRHEFEITMQGIDMCKQERDQYEQKRKYI